MKDVKQINFTENRQAIATEIRSAFGADFSQKFVEEWIQIIIDEAEGSRYKDYRIEHKENKIPPMHFLNKEEMIIVYNLLKEGHMRFGNCEL